jgi:sterol 24-C-methyltransferase
MRTAKQARDAFKSSGFEILVDEDMAERNDMVDWWYPLEGDLRKVCSFSSPPPLPSPLFISHIFFFLDACGKSWRDSFRVCSDVQAQTPYDILTCFRTSKLGQVLTHNAVWGLEKLGLVPKGTHEVGETLRLAGDALVKGGQQGLFTPMHLFIVRKPEN